MSRVRFIDYTGAYPNLCSGELKLWIDGVYITLPEGCLESGGEVDLVLRKHCQSSVESRFASILRTIPRRN